VFIANRVERDEYAVKYPWLTAQVEGHLVFGPLSRYPWMTDVILLAIILIAFGGRLLTSDLSSAALIGKVVDLAVFILFLVLLYHARIRFSGIQKASLLWISMKLSFAMFALIFALSGLVKVILSEYKYSWTNIVMGILWMPGPEFLPFLSKDQKFITFCRVILSIPLIYFGFKGGSMSWLAGF